MYDGSNTDLEVLVGCLLPFLGHGVRRRSGEHAHRGEDGQTDTNAENGVEGDLLALTRRGKSSRTVRTKRDPVGCMEPLS